MTLNTVKKAVIPAAGFGTRLFPTTKIFKKEFFPIIDRDGRAKPVILLIVEEALSAGIEEIGIVIQASDKSLFESFFKLPPKPELYQKLSPENQEYSDYLLALGQKITLLTQEKQEGYGHAVFSAKQWVGREPFLLLLGDHIYAAEGNVTCAKQLVDVYSRVNKSTIALTIMPAEIIHKAGVVKGIWEVDREILSLEQIYEKPDLDYARSHLQTEHLSVNEFLAIFGMYILESQIFDYLEAEITQNIRYKGEFQLTTCLEKMRRDRGMIGYLVKGQYFDTGMPQFYRQTMIDFGSPDIIW